MPQASLPDINTAFIKYRNQAIFNMENGRYDAAVGSLYAFNGCLPEDYRVKISTIEYEAKTQEKLNAKCPYCDEEIEVKDMQIEKLLNPLIIGVFTKEKYDKVWHCGKCNHVNRLVETEMIKYQLEEPSFLGIVPKPPERKDSLTDRRQFDIKFQNWCWKLLDELEAKAAKFRRDYTPKDGSELEQLEGKTGEELDT
uniref:ORF77 n=1 Tax=Nitrosopumilaceae spindle-shaped virus TaxID=3065433 RepID=A0AAT9JH75_9VIRU